MVPEKAKTPPPQKQPRIREDERRGVFVDGCTRTRCRSAEECIDAFRAGSRRRAVRGTAKNDRSSRSHAVFTLELTRTTTRGAATVTQAAVAAQVHQSLDIHGDLAAKIARGPPTTPQLKTTSSVWPSRNWW